MNDKCNTTRYFVVWFIMNLVDISILAISIYNMNLYAAILFLAMLCILIAVYHDTSLDLMRQFGRLIYYRFCIIFNIKNQAWHAVSKVYRYEFTNKHKMTNNKLLTIKSKVDRLHVIEDKFSFSKEVKSVKYEIGTDQSTYSVIQTKDSLGYHRVKITLATPLPRGHETEVNYFISVEDPEEETYPIYGTTISQVTELLDISVKIPPELNPKKIFFRVYSNNVETTPSYQEPLLYSQEDHLIRKVIRYPKLFKRYTIEWEW